MINYHRTSGTPEGMMSYRISNILYSFYDIEPIKLDTM